MGAKVQGRKGNARNYQGSKENGGNDDQRSFSFPRYFIHGYL